ncbi:MAG: type I restriction endonuclease MjaXP subunit S [Thermonema sp.]|uniref:restriction endonuclease subunit S n=1 Tax=Thermonema TaxID=28194 RepID=UPI00056F0055|nr:MULTISPECIES: restriction endonuclease subunit S [Thermonema]GIV40197.1 MAG: type I restriction endonuclease MjaXP subunit S [Thermonema sp.]
MSDTLNRSKCEWKKYKLGEIAEIVGGGTPKTSVAEYWNGDIPWLSVVDFNNGKKYVYDTEKKITEEGLKNSSTKLLEKGDIIISARGTVGIVAMLGKQMAFNQSCYGIRANEYSTNEYVYYLLKDRVSNFLQYSHGGVFDTITRDTFKEIEILLPPLPEQKAIAEVLSSLDDKIDLLHRQNKTLEQMAETLFRQWFVENPNPEWEEKPLSSIATFLNGLACQKYPPKNDIDKLPVLKIKELRNGISKDCDWCTTDVDEKYVVENGDVIFSWSASLMVKIWDGESCILNQHLFKVTSDEFPKWYYYLWSRYHLEQFIAIATAQATTMGHIKRKDLDNAMVLVPTDDELKNMTNKIQPLIDKQIVNSKQIRTLEKLRDTLLPKLMSGEVRVKF